ncbi:unnamed protein product [Wuchereria bancrofti]|uniref:Uncharacterized protein n=1 Tax=Wuchereria bancrofti TaxID=6293 RepID=A0A3P7FPF1_WUCBA|nr:unnamed protein product [Wuchereria bancrofti]
MFYSMKIDVYENTEDKMEDKSKEPIACRTKSVKSYKLQLNQKINGINNIKAGVAKKLINRRGLLHKVDVHTRTHNTSYKMQQHYRNDIYQSLSQTITISGIRPNN